MARTARRAGLTSRKRRGRLRETTNGEVEAGRPPGARGSEVSIVMAGPVVFAIEEAPDVLPFRFALRMRFAEDERVLPLQIAPPPFPMAQPPPAA